MFFKVPRCENFHNFRYFALFVVWFDQLTTYTCRINLSIGILGIQNYLKQTTGQELSDYHKLLLLSAFNIGYLIAHLPGAICCLVFGSRIVMLVSLALTALFTFLCIPAFYYSYASLFAVRVLVGAACGTVLPIVQQFNSNYSCPTERSRFVLIAMTGNVASLVLMFPIGSYLVEKFTEGWEFCFYISGSITLISFILHFLFVFDTPAQNPWMSNFEQDKILKEKYPNGPPPKKTVKNFPYYKIFTSPATYTLMSGHFGKLLIMNMNLFGLVSYYKKHYNLSSLNSGLLAIIPFALDFFVHFGYDIVVLWLKPLMTTTNLRRVNTLIGTVGCSGFLLGLAFIKPENVVVGIIISSCGMLLIPAYQVGYFAAIIDYAPECSLITMAYINVAGSLSGVVQLQLTGYILKNSSDVHTGYKYSFILTSVVSFIFSMVYVLFGTAEKQPWDSTAQNAPVSLQHIQKNEAAEQEKKDKEDEDSEYSESEKQDEESQESESSQEATA